MFTGVITALVSPMDANGEINLNSLEKLVERQISAGVQGLVVNGSTGESPTVTPEEFEKMVETVVKKAAKRVPVIAGTGSNSTLKTIETSKKALALGVDACLIIAPYYNKPTQEGIYAHYKAISDKVPLPIILYNHPGRTGCNIAPETTGRLAEIANIVALKESNMTLSQIDDLLNRVEDKIDILTGNDEDALSAMLLGFKGVISVVSNVAPKSMRALCDAALAGNRPLARKLNKKLLPLYKEIFSESNPIPCKWLLHDMGLIPEGIRLPLSSLSQKHHQDLRSAFKFVGEEV
ncbi:MAG TPA: 4-hydroxy-tetrahydrodipicolinate synthase [Gammaproteobacteria bacterium]|nr:4-hydroxy-tetrahydrodipicolinate synthase [Gammaproteobacteria bacterium]